MQGPWIKPLAIDDSNKVNDLVTTLIVVVEGQDIPSEVMLPNCEELLHTFTTKICTHNKNLVRVKLLCSVV